jgi:hypothetical protein
VDLYLVPSQTRPDADLVAADFGIDPAQKPVIR